MTFAPDAAPQNRSPVHVASLSDAEAIADVWNAVIRDTTLTFTSDTKTGDDIRQLLQEKDAADYPFFVTRDNGGCVTGFATYGPFRSGSGYRHTVEQTVYLTPAAQGAGLGRQLVSALIKHARQHGIHSIWAGCSADNPGAVAFHIAMGFAQIAHLPQVGRKFDRWLDLILLQKIL